MRIICLLFLVLSACDISRLEDDSLEITPKTTSNSVGIAALAAQAFNEDQCDLLISTVNRLDVPRLAFLYGTFGRSAACIKRFTTAFLDRPHELLIYATNQVCVRRNFCEAVDKEPITQRALELKAFIGDVSNPNTKVILSRGLEDTFSPDAYAYIDGVLSATIPGVQASVNPLTSSVREIPPTALLELHNEEVPSRRPCVWTNDGRDILAFAPSSSSRAPTLSWDLETLESYLRRAEHCRRFLWVNWQGFSEPPLPPSQRHITIDADEARNISEFLLTYEE